MKAITVTLGEEGPLLRWDDAADPTYGPEEVLVEVKASAVNRADLAQAMGNYPPPAGVTDILGLEMAGVVTAVGQKVQAWQVGDRVCALLPGGGYAELASVHQDMLLRLPEEWSFAQGAAVPEVWYTAFVNLFLEGELKAGETVLVHAGASGVGTAAIQLGKAAGATVFVTAGSPEKLAACRELGADVAINYRGEDFLEVVMASTEGKGVNLILDPVGASYLSRNLKVMCPYGRMVNIGSLGGNRAELDIGQILGKSLRMIGSRLRPRPLSEKINITKQFKARVWPGLVSGSLRPVIDRVFPLPNAQAAHAYVRENRNVGKVILERKVPKI